MSIELGGSLLVLALIDSLSVGTLLIPVFFLLTPGRLRGGRIVTYLVTIALFYFAVGTGVALGAVTFLPALADVLETRPAQVVQLIVGAGLLIGSFFIKKRPEGADNRPGRLTRWRERAMAEKGSSGALVALALAAGIIEVATMLPYLAAIGLITTSELGAVERTGALAAYCLVMIVPALLLVALRLVARRAVEPQLERLGAWLQKNGAENTAWIIGIVGFLLGRDAALRLGLFN